MKGIVKGTIRDTPWRKTTRVEIARRHLGAGEVRCEAPHFNIDLCCHFIW